MTLINRRTVLTGLATGMALTLTTSPANAKPVPAPPPQPRTLRMGASGKAVGTLQRRLVAAGFPVGKDGIDEKYGNDTYWAVYGYQAFHKLDKDGVAGPITQGHLSDNPRPPARRFKGLHPAWKEPGRHIIAVKKDRASYLFEDGKFVTVITTRFGGYGWDVNTKKYTTSNTPAGGPFWIFHKDKNGYSYIYKSEMPYFVVFNGHIGFHYSDNFREIGFGANGKWGSKGCLNIGNKPQARQLFDFAQVNYTKVYVMNKRS